MASHCAQFLLLLLTLLPGTALRGEAASPGPLVYHCESGGVPEYTDRPCSPQAPSRHVSASRLNTYTAAEAAHLDPSTPVSATAQRARGAHAAAAARVVAQKRAHEVACDTLQMRIDRVNSRMRAGYRIPRGERLRAQWHQLKDDYYRQRCLGPH